MDNRLPFIVALACFAAVILSLFVTCPVQAFASPAGPEWTEMKDAGKLPGGAQVPQGIGVMNKIHGKLEGEEFVAGGDYQDVYLIRVVDFENFIATLAPPTAGGAADFDTQLWLFGLDERGILANDEASAGSGYSALGDAADDGSGAALTSNGLYYLAITGLDSDAQSPGGDIFLQATRTEVSGPDGPGGSIPVTQPRYPNWYRLRDK